MQHYAIWADCVEKLRISDVASFRKEPVIRKSQMGSAKRRSELPHERHKTNLAKPLASKCWSRRTDKNFTDFAKNRVLNSIRTKQAFGKAAAQLTKLAQIIQLPITYIK